MSRPYTTEEMRQIFLDHVRSMVDYWSDPQQQHHMGSRKSVAGSLSGFAHSFLAMLSGCSMDLPGLDVTPPQKPTNLVPAPHPEDEAYHRENEDNWWVPEDINNGNLHYELYNGPGGRVWADRMQARDDQEPLTPSWRKFIDVSLTLGLKVIAPTGEQFWMEGSNLVSNLSGGETIDPLISRILYGHLDDPRGYQAVKR